MNLMGSMTSGLYYSPNRKLATLTVSAAALAACTSSRTQTPPTATCSDYARSQFMLINSQQGRISTLEQERTGLGLGVVALGLYVLKQHFFGKKGA